jgi:uncharacterized phage-associated protein
MAYNSISVANKVIDILRDIKDKGYNPSIMELVKLCFIAHGFYLAKYNTPLFNDDETIQAWPYGPVPVNLYKDFRSQGITIKEKSQTTNDIALNDNKEGYDYIKSVIKHYSQFDPFALSDITHEEGSPWTEIVKRYGLYTIIPNDLIRDYYKSL